MSAEFHKALSELRTLLCSKYGLGADDDSDENQGLVVWDRGSTEVQLYWEAPSHISATFHFRET